MKNKLNKWFKLKKNLNTFNVPEQRKDITKLENVIWLGCNLPIKNLDNPLLNETMTEINELGKTLLREEPMFNLPVDDWWNR